MTATPGILAVHQRVCWKPRTLERLFEIGKVDTSEPEACWEWNRSRDRWGYGRINGVANPVRVCRAVVELTDGRGPLLPDEIPLHSCDYHPCCNLHHLSRGKQLDNVRDMIAKGRQGGVQIMSSDERKALWVQRRVRAGQS